MLKTCTAVLLFLGDHFMHAVLHSRVAVTVYAPLLAFIGVGVTKCQTLGHEPLLCLKTYDTSVNMIRVFPSGILYYTFSTVGTV